MKKLFNFFLVILLFGLFSSVAFASESDLQELQEEINKANAEIQELIDEAIEEADEEMEEYLEEGDQDEYNANIDEIIDELIEETNEIASDMIEEAEEKGFEVVCEWITVIIGDREVMIDPLTIVGT